MDNVTGLSIGLADGDDIAAIERLLLANGLPIDGVRECVPHAIVARADGRLVGCAALELFQSGALLRSVVVDETWRGRGLGERLVEEAFVLARSKGATAAYLLTTTVPEFFARFGFDPIDRASVPADIQQSVEFTSACPASAIVMHGRIRGHIW